MKGVLLAVSGLNPQVITETLYALYQSNQEIDAVHVITTREGKERVYAELLGGKNGHYYTFLEEYGINPTSIQFDHENVHVTTDEYGNELPDILDESDNERLLKKCMELTFRLTKDPDTAVYFSIAGGRKTMSSCLTLAAQLYGRPHDRLYHVLVSPEFESNRGFYYPPKKSRTIELKDSQGNSYHKESRFACINLINIPFVSVRDQLSPDHLNEPKDPATLMLSLIKEKAARMTVNLVEKKLIFKRTEMDMHPAHLALYAFFVMRKKQCKKEDADCRHCTDCFLGTQEVFDRQAAITDLYIKLCGTRPIEEMSDTGIICLNAENFQSFKSKIKKNLQSMFGPYALAELEIASVGSKPDTKYGILMNKGKMEIVY